MTADICDLMDKAARLSAELAALALTSAAKALRRARTAEHLPPSARTDIKSASRIVEAQLGWSAA